ncbi:hypothetical protein TNCV_4285601 [Trichonephila clavipes]|nr:hypothetical protein TNCV_4285601 [Trichonephila clavipes]
MGNISWTSRRCVTPALNKDSKSHGREERSLMYLEVSKVHPPGASRKADWKYTRIYHPQRRLRVLVEKSRKDSSQTKSSLAHAQFSVKCQVIRMAHKSTYHLDT